MDYRCNFPLNIFFSSQRLVDYLRISHSLWSIRRVLFLFTKCTGKLGALANAPILRNALRIVCFKAMSVLRNLFFNVNAIVLETTENLLKTLRHMMADCESFEIGSVLDSQDLQLKTLKASFLAWTNNVKHAAQF